MQAAAAALRRRAAARRRCTRGAVGDPVLTHDAAVGAGQRSQERGSRRNDVLDDKRRLRLDSSISCPCCATSRKSRALRVRGVSDTA